MLKLRHTAISLAAASIAAVALPAASASAAPELIRDPSYFKVSFSATEAVSWHEDVTGHGCGGDRVVASTGQGHVGIRVATPSPQPAVLWRTRDSRKVGLLFGGNSRGFPVRGTYAREGAIESRPADGGPCGDSEPSDCAVRRYPAGTKVHVAWLTPGNTPPRSDLTPRSPSLFIGGPLGWDPDPDWPGFGNCPTMEYDGQLGALRGDVPEAGWGALPPSRAFGRKRQFTVTGGLNDTVDLTTVFPDSFLSGENLVTTKVRWKMRFTRVARRPAGL
jgi:hypothetical protein